MANKAADAVVVWSQLASKEGEEKVTPSACMGAVCLLQQHTELKWKSRLAEEVLADDVELVDQAISESDLESIPDA